MPDASSDNKRIAKNTFLLYLRMFFVMCISLYTSRIVLNTLGVVDFGIFNVVGGIVVLFSFVNYAMTNATQRYITYSLGINEGNGPSKIFNTAILVHLVIACLVILLAESIGLWLLLNKMTIPTERMDTAMWVYQLTVFGSVLVILNVPYNSDIIAHENMGIYAYISIFEVLMKLISVYILTIIDYDKLKLYALFIFVIQMLTFCIYRLYCKNKYAETRFRIYKDKKLIVEMTSFAGWSLVGNLAAVLSTQGVNILLNTFFGPVVNAARGVATQVQSAIVQISSNFQMAINPQITKSYAVNDLERMRSLVFMSSKFSFSLLLILALPIFMEAPLLLKIWLINVPDYSVSFLRIIICIILVEVTSDSLAIANQATGKVRAYQATVGLCNLLIIPLSYICLKLWEIPIIVFFVNLVVSIVSQIVRLLFMRRYISLNIIKFFKKVYGVCIVILGISSLLPTIVYYNMNEGLLRLFLVSTISIISVLLSVFYIGFSYQERKVIVDIVLSKIGSSKAVRFIR